MRIRSQSVACLLAIVLIVLGVSGCSQELKVGDTFSFGSYGGWHTVWRVLEIRDNKALLTTKYAIDVRDYHEGGGETTWADCSLRRWLNDSYINTSFSGSERDVILKTTLADTGTEDHIFLLSPAEVNQYFPSSDNRFVSLNMAKEVEEAYAQRVGNDETYSLAYDGALTFIQDLDEHDSQPMIWWLRSSGEKSDSAPMVTPYGEFGSIGNTPVYGFPPFAPTNGVRPAMWVDLESIDLPKYLKAPKISSQKTATPSPQSEFCEYVNEDYGFAAQFPAEPDESYSEQDGAREIVFSSQASAESPNVPARTSVNVLEFSGPVSELDKDSLRKLIEILAAERIHVLAGISAEETNNLAIEHGIRSGYPSASAIVPRSNNGQRMWYYATVVFRDGLFINQMGVRGSEAEALKAEASLRLLELPKSQDHSNSSPPAKSPIPSDAISWTEAAQHVGEVVTVFGTIMDTKYATNAKGKPTFLDIGVAYPGTNRVTAVIWRKYRDSFSKSPESMYPRGSTICVTGELYRRPSDGVLNIEVRSPSQIQVME